MLSVIFAGDVAFNSIEDTVDYAYSKEVLRELKPVLFGADLRVVNLENPLAPSGMGAPIRKSGPNLLGRPKNIGFLTAGRFDCAVLANNHFGDYGPDVCINTLRLLRESGIAYVGGGRNIDEAYTAWRVEKKGVRFSLVAVCENEFGIATREAPGAAGFSYRRLGARLREEKAVSDYVVVEFHGGCEHNPVPSPGAVERYRTICDLGADAVVAMHTHCPQGWEMYGGKPIIYSLGNFYFPRSSSPKPAGSPWYYGYMARLNFGDGTVTPEFFPYVCAPDGSRLHAFVGEDYEKFIDYLEKISAPIADDIALEALYSGWVAANSYPRGLQFREGFTSDETSPDEKSLPGVKNLLGCEAHNEVCRTYLRLAFEGRLTESAAQTARLNELKVMPV